MMRAWLIAGLVAGLCLGGAAEARAQGAPGASSEDTDAPAPKKGGEGDELPFYKPTPQELALAPAPPPPPPEPPPPPPPPKPLLVSGLLDFRSFALGTIRGSATEVRGRFGSDVVGVTAGALVGEQALFVLGLDVARYLGIPLNGAEPKIQYSILTPHFDFGPLLSPDIIGFRGGTSLTGFRVATCKWEASLRLPTLSGYFLTETETPGGTGFALDLGVSLSASYRIR